MLRRVRITAPIGLSESASGRMDAEVVNRRLWNFRVLRSMFERRCRRVRSAYWADCLKPGSGRNKDLEKGLGDEILWMNCL